MEFPVDILSTVDNETLEQSAKDYMSKLLYRNPDTTEFLSLSDSRQVHIGLCNVGFVPLYGADIKQKVLAVFPPEDHFTAVGLYLLGRWWSVEDILKTSDSSRKGLLEVRTTVERIVLYVLNRIVYRAKELATDEVPFLCHGENDIAKVLWRDGQAIGFYSVKPEGSLCSTFLTQHYQLPVMDTIFIRKHHRGKGYGLQMLEDFVDSFKKDILGMKYPISTAMYKVCEKYLSTYPADKDLLWEVEGVGGPFQRTHIANKIQAMSLRGKYQAGGMSETTINQESDNDALMEEETPKIQETMEYTMEVEEMVQIKVSEEITNTTVTAHSISMTAISRLESEKITEENLSEKIIRVEDIEAGVESATEESTTVIEMIAGVDDSQSEQEKVDQEDLTQDTLALTDVTVKDIIETQDLYIEEEVAVEKVLTSQPEEPLLNILDKYVTEPATVTPDVGVEQEGKDDAPQIISDDKQSSQEDEETQTQRDSIMEVEIVKMTSEIDEEEKTRTPDEILSNENEDVNKVDGEETEQTETQKEKIKVKKGDDVEESTGETNMCGKTSIRVLRVRNISQVTPSRRSGRLKEKPLEDEKVTMEKSAKRQSSRNKASPLENKASKQISPVVGDVDGSEASPALEKRVLRRSERESTVTPKRKSHRFTKQIKESSKTSPVKSKEEPVSKPTGAERHEVADSVKKSSGEGEQPLNEERILRSGVKAIKPRHKRQYTRVSRTDGHQNDSEQSTDYPKDKEEPEKNEEDTKQEEITELQKENNGQSLDSVEDATDQVELKEDEDMKKDESLKLFETEPVSTEDDVVENQEVKGQEGEQVVNDDVRENREGIQDVQTTAEQPASDNELAQEMKEKGMVENEDITETETETVKEIGENTVEHTVEESTKEEKTIDEERDNDKTGRMEEAEVVDEENIPEQSLADTEHVEVVSGEPDAEIDEKEKEIKMVKLLESTVLLVDVSKYPQQAEVDKNAKDLLDQGVEERKELDESLEIVEGKEANKEMEQTETHEKSMEESEDIKEGAKEADKSVAKEKRVLRSRLKVDLSPSRRSGRLRKLPAETDKQKEATPKHRYTRQSKLQLNECETKQKQKVVKVTPQRRSRRLRDESVQDDKEGKEGTEHDAETEDSAKDEAETATEDSEPAPVEEAETYEKQPGEEEKQEEIVHLEEEAEHVAGQEEMDRHDEVEEVDEEVEKTNATEQENTGLAQEHISESNSANKEVTVQDTETDDIVAETENIVVESDKREETDENCPEIGNENVDEKKATEKGDEIEDEVKSTGEGEAETIKLQKASVLLENLTSIPQQLTTEPEETMEVHNEKRPDESAEVDESQLTETQEEKAEVEVGEGSTETDKPAQRVLKSRPKTEDAPSRRSSRLKKTFTVVDEPKEVTPKRRYTRRSKVNESEPQNKERSGEEEDEGKTEQTEKIGEEEKAETDSAQEENVIQSSVVQTDQTEEQIVKNQASEDQQKQEETTEAQEIPVDYEAENEMALQAEGNIGEAEATKKGENDQDGEKAPILEEKDVTVLEGEDIQKEGKAETETVQFLKATVVLVDLNKCPQQPNVTEGDRTIPDLEEKGKLEMGKTAEVKEGQEMNRAQETEIEKTETQDEETQEEGTSVEHTSDDAEKPVRKGKQGLRSRSIVAKVTPPQRSRHLRDQPVQEDEEGEENLLCALESEDSPVGQPEEDNEPAPAQGTQEYDKQPPGEERPEEEIQLDEEAENVADQERKEEEHLVEKDNEVVKDSGVEQGNIGTAQKDLIEADILEGAQLDEMNKDEVEKETLLEEITTDNENIIMEDKITEATEYCPVGGKVSDEIEDEGKSTELVVDQKEEEEEVHEEEPQVAADSVKDLHRDEGRQIEADTFKLLQASVVLVNLTSIPQHATVETEKATEIDDDKRQDETAEVLENQTVQQVEEETVERTETEGEKAEAEEVEESSSEADKPVQRVLRSRPKTADAPSRRSGRSRKAPTVVEEPKEITPKHRYTRRSKVNESESQSKELSGEEKDELKTKQTEEIGEEEKAESDSAQDLTEPQSSVVQTDQIVEQIVKNQAPENRQEQEETTKVQDIAVDYVAEKVLETPSRRSSRLRKAPAVIDEPQDVLPKRRYTRRIKLNESEPENKESRGEEKHEGKIEETDETGAMDEQILEDQAVAEQQSHGKAAERDELSGKDSAEMETAFDIEKNVEETEATMESEKQQEEIMEGTTEKDVALLEGDETEKVDFQKATPTETKNEKIMSENEEQELNKTTENKEVIETDKAQIEKTETQDVETQEEGTSVEHTSDDAEKPVRKGRQGLRSRSIVAKVTPPRRSRRLRDQPVQEDEEGEEKLLCAVESEDSPVGQPEEDNEPAPAQGTLEYDKQPPGEERPEEEIQLDEEAENVADQERKEEEHLVEKDNEVVKDSGVEQENIGTAQKDLIEADILEGAQLDEMNKDEVEKETLLEEITTDNENISMEDKITEATEYCPVGGKVSDEIEDEGKSTELVVDQKEEEEEVHEEEPQVAADSVKDLHRDEGRQIEADTFKLLQASVVLVNLTSIPQHATVETEKATEIDDDKRQDETAEVLENQTVQQVEEETVERTETEGEKAEAEEVEESSSEADKPVQRVLRSRPKTADAPSRRSGRSRKAPTVVEEPKEITPKHRYTRRSKVNESESQSKELSGEEKDELKTKQTEEIGEEEKAESDSAQDLTEPQSSVVQTDQIVEQIVKNQAPENRQEQEETTKVQDIAVDYVAEKVLETPSRRSSRLRKAPAVIDEPQDVPLKRRYTRRIKLNESEPENKESTGEEKDEGKIEETDKTGEMDEQILEDQAVAEQQSHGKAGEDAAEMETAFDIGKNVEETEATIESEKQQEEIMEGTTEKDVALLEGDETEKVEFQKATVVLEHLNECPQSPTETENEKIMSENEEQELNKTTENKEVIETDEAQIEKTETQDEEAQEEGTSVEHTSDDAEKTVRRGSPGPRSRSKAAEVTPPRRSRRLRDQPDQDVEEGEESRECDVETDDNAAADPETSQEESKSAPREETEEYEKQPAGEERQEETIQLEEGVEIVMDNERKEDDNLVENEYKEIEKESAVEQENVDIDQNADSAIKDEVVQGTQTDETNEDGAEMERLLEEIIAENENILMEGEIAEAIENCPEVEHENMDEGKVTGEGDELKDEGKSTEHTCEEEPLLPADNTETSLETTMEAEKTMEIDNEKKQDEAEKADENQIVQEVQEEEMELTETQEEKAEAEVEEGSTETDKPAQRVLRSRPKTEDAPSRRSGRLRKAPTVVDEPKEITPKSRFTRRSKVNESEPQNKECSGEEEDEGKTEQTEKIGEEEKAESDSAQEENVIQSSVVQTDQTEEQIVKNQEPEDQQKQEETTKAQEIVVDHEAEKVLEAPSRRSSRLRKAPAVIDEPQDVPPKRRYTQRIKLIESEPENKQESTGEEKDEGKIEETDKTGAMDEQILEDQAVAEQQSHGKTAEIDEPEAPKESEKQQKTGEEEKSESESAQEEKGEQESSIIQTNQMENQKVEDQQQSEKIIEAVETAEEDAAENKMVIDTEERVEETEAAKDSEIVEQVAEKQINIQETNLVLEGGIEETSSFNAELKGVEEGKDALQEKSAVGESTLDTELLGTVIEEEKKNTTGVEEESNQIISAEDGSAEKERKEVDLKAIDNEKNISPDTQETEAAQKSSDEKEETPVLEKRSLRNRMVTVKSTPRRKSKRLSKKDKETDADKAEDAEVEKEKLGGEKGEMIEEAVLEQQEEAENEIIERKRTSEGGITDISIVETEIHSAEEDKVGDKEAESAEEAMEMVIATDQERAEPEKKNVAENLTEDEKRVQDKTEDKTSEEAEEALSEKTVENVETTEDQKGNELQEHENREGATSPREEKETAQKSSDEEEQAPVLEKRTLRKRTITVKSTPRRKSKRLHKQQVEANTEAEAETEAGTTEEEDNKRNDENEKASTKELMTEDTEETVAVGEIHPSGLAVPEEVAQGSETDNEKECILEQQAMVEGKEVEKNADDKESQLEEKMEERHEPQTVAEKENEDGDNFEEKNEAAEKITEEAEEEEGTRIEGKETVTVVDEMEEKGASKEQDLDNVELGRNEESEENTVEEGENMTHLTEEIKEDDEDQAQNADSYPADSADDIHLVLDEEEERAITDEEKASEEMELEPEVSPKEAPILVEEAKNSREEISSEDAAVTASPVQKSTRCSKRLLKMDESDLEDNSPLHQVKDSSHGEREKKAHRSKKRAKVDPTPTRRSHRRSRT